MDAMPHSPNHLLATLPQPDFERLRPHLQTIELVQETVLVGAGDRLTQVFFPHSGVISLVVSLAGGMVEVAMVGRDSIFGGSAALDGNISLTDAIVQLAGRASTLEVGLLRTAAKQSIAFRTMLIRHEQASLRKPSSPLPAMPCIRLKPAWRAGYCVCTIWQVKTDYTLHRTSWPR